MPRANPQSLCERFHAAVFESALCDQSKGSRYRGGCAKPRRRPRAAFGTATEARAETRFSRGRRRRKVAAVLLLRRGGRTDRSTIHAASEHTNVELAVEARIARQPRPRTYPPVQIHTITPMPGSAISARPSRRAWAGKTLHGRGR